MKRQLGGRRASWVEGGNLLPLQLEKLLGGLVQKQGIGRGDRAILAWLLLEVLRSSCVWVTSPIIL